MMCRVAMTKTLKYWQKDLSPFTSFTLSHARQKFVISPAQVLGKRSRGTELEDAEEEVKALGLGKYCSVFEI